MAVTRELPTHESPTHWLGKKAAAEAGEDPVRAGSGSGAPGAVGSPGETEPAPAAAADNGSVAIFEGPVEVVGDDHRAAPSDSADIFEVPTAFQALQVKDPADLEEWWSSMRGKPAHTNLFMELHRSNPQAAHQLARAVSAMPTVGSDFAGFRLLYELGKGAFAKVYLARQSDLAERYVVLKVSPEAGAEPQTLAQLQHTNVVPIYSLHRASPLQAVCMPYLGSLTLSAVLKEIQGRGALPESGKGLVSTLVDRKSTTVPYVTPPSSGSAPSSAPGAEDSGLTAPGAPARQVVGSTVILEKLEKMSYVEAVLWLAARLADGLAHAHEHHIIHRDLKPANILVTDEGQPMLLDFNLAQDLKPGVFSTAALVGGTLPYMAPEQLTAYRAQTTALNPNSDIYSLGVILFELLTGRHPFPVHKGPVHQIVTRMIADRQQPPPALRCWNPTVTPAVESIVRKCLEPDTSRRYQSARHLQEDLERHLEHKTLRYAAEPSLKERARKWVRRHPQMTSTTSIGMVAAVSLVVLGTLLGMNRYKVAQLEARQTFSRFQEAKQSIQFDLTAPTGNVTDQVAAGMRRCEETLASYRVLNDEGWDKQGLVTHLSADEQQKLRSGLGELCLLLARANLMQARTAEERAACAGRVDKLTRLAAACLGGEETSRAVVSQRAELADLRGEAATAAELRARAANMPPQTATDFFLSATQLNTEGAHVQALPLLTAASERFPESFWIWFQLGITYDGLGRYFDAASCYTTCVALEPGSARAYYNRGLARLNMNGNQGAIADFSEVVRLQPEQPVVAQAYILRAIAKQRQKNYKGACDDLALALDHKAPAAQVYHLRSRVWQEKGDADRAKADFEAGLREEPTDEIGYLYRGWTRMQNNEREGALADYDQALKLNPRSRNALQNKARLLGLMGRPEENLKHLDVALKFYPHYLTFRSTRGVIHARLGHKDAALRDADEALRQDAASLDVVYQVAGIYALLSARYPELRQKALQLLGRALGKGYGLELIPIDRELDPIRGLPEFRRMIDAAEYLRGPVSSSSAPKR